MGNLVLELQVISAVCFDRDESQKKNNPDEHSKYCKNLIARTHKEVIYSMKKYRKTESCKEILDGIVLGYRMDVYERKAS